MLGPRMRGCAGVSGKGKKNVLGRGKSTRKDEDWENSTVHYRYLQVVQHDLGDRMEVGAFQGSQERGEQVGVKI